MESQFLLPTVCEVTWAEIAETVHTLNGTKQAFRLIVRRGLNPQPHWFETERYGYHAVASRVAHTSSSNVCVPKVAARPSPHGSRHPIHR